MSMRILAHRFRHPRPQVIYTDGKGPLVHCDVREMNVYGTGTVELVLAGKVYGGDRVDLHGATETGRLELCSEWEEILP